MKLTAKQREALQILARGRVNPFDFGSTTVSRLRKAGLVRSVTPEGERASVLEITSAGRRVLAGGPASCSLHDPFGGQCDACTIAAGDRVLPMYYRGLQCGGWS